MSSISEFSLFDELNDSKSQSKQKPSLDNISKNIKNTSVFSLGKDININSHSTTNDKTIHDSHSQKQKNIENIKEVSSFTLCDNPRPLNRKLNFFNEEEMDMDESQEKDSSISDSPIKEKDINYNYSNKNSQKSKNNKNTISGNESEDEEETEFKYIKRQSKNSFSFATPKFDEDYIIIKTLYKGEMSTVYLCMKFQDRKIYVVKTTNFFVRKFDYYKMKKFLECINTNVNFPESKFIQKYIDFWIEEDLKNNSKTSNKNMYIVTDYCLGGDLKEFINKVRESNFKYDKDFYLDIIFQMIVSVAFLHKLGYVHFDIKPSNFLVQENGRLLLCDFCLSIKEQDIINYSSEEFEGDSMYISPELFYKDKDIINNKTDIFSLGLSILQILTNVELPKNGLTWQFIRTAGIPQEFLDQIPYLNGYNKILKNLIITMTNHNSENRPNLEKILNDKDNYPFLYERYHLLLKDNYIYKFDINNISNFKRDSYDFSSSIGNFKKRFAKRSDSMKIVNISSEVDKK